MKNTLFLLYDSYALTKCEKTKKAFQLYRYQYKFALKEAKRQYYNQKIENSSNKVRTAWSIVNCQKRNDKMFEGGFSACDFNNYVVTAVDAIVGSLPRAQTMCDIVNQNQSFYCYPTTPKEIKTIILNLKNSQSRDCYRLNALLLKVVADELCVPLTRLVNTSFCTGIFPDLLKVSKIIPIYKKGSKTDLNNYRPISILPVVVKVFENVIKSRLLKYFEKFNLLSSSQYGYRPGRSTTSAIMDMIEAILNGFESGFSCVATMFDLTRAFDCVSHTLLLQKLEKYGVRGVPNSLIGSYLQNRVQYACVGDDVSTTTSIKYGVPQGSVLGPILFIIYINDISLNNKNSKLYLYADDTTVLSINKDINFLNISSIIEEAAVSLWFASNNLSLNSQKTQRLVLSLATNQSIPRNVVKLLGFHIDTSLTWVHHVEYISRKLSSAIYLIRYVSQYLSEEYVRMTYFAAFHSIISYGVILWGSSSQADYIFTLQKKAVRIVAKADSYAHCRPLFEQLKILPLPCLFILECLLFIKDRPKTLQCDIHSMNTRYVNDIRIPRYRLTRTMKHFNYFAVKFYNKLPLPIRKLNKFEYKNKIKCILLKNCFYSINEFLDYNFVSDY